MKRVVGHQGKVLAIDLIVDHVPSPIDLTNRGARPGHRVLERRIDRDRSLEVAVQMLSLLGSLFPVGNPLRIDRDHVLAIVGGRN
jgi:hypothetical protein